jgi:hypothetical protein
VNGSTSPDPVLVEQVKLGATLLNTVAAGCVVAGIITPLVGIAVGALRTEFDPRLVIVFCALLYPAAPYIGRRGGISGGLVHDPQRDTVAAA